MKRDDDTVFWIVFLFVAVVWWFFLLGRTPVVTMTWPDRECVRVEPARAGDCGHLPRKYEIRWVGR